jgi:class 3 adenylate cyclase
VVYRETEGNPFFVHEIVQLLQSDGRLDRAEEVASWSLEIPQGVRQVVGQRLSALSEECNRILSIASVIGREFELPVLAAVSELPEDGFLELLDRAQDARIIGELAGAAGTYRFSHALVRETLYEEIRTNRRLRLHRRIAEVIETLYAARLEPHLGQLAYHFCEAASGGDLDKAIEYSLRAAERDAATHAHEEAAGHYERAISALEAAESADEPRLCELLLSLGEAQLRSGTLPRFRQTFRRAMELARELRSPEQFARAAQSLETSLPIPGTINEEHVAALEEALSLLGDEDSVVRADVMVHLALALLWAKSSERREHLCRDAVDMARRLGDRAAVARALGMSNYVIGRRDDPAARLAAAEEIFAIGEELNDWRLLAWGHTGEIIALIELAEGQALDRAIDANHRLMEELRNAVGIGWALVRRAMQALWQGRLAEAARLSAEGTALYRRIDPEIANQALSAQMFALLRMQGRLDEVLTPVREGLERFPGNPTWRCTLALAYAEIGRESEARLEFEKLAEDDFAFLDYDPFHLIDLGYLADVCNVLGDAKRAAPLYDRLLDYKGRYLALETVVTGGSVARSRGLLAAAMQRWNDAACHFDEAIEVDKRMLAWGWLPRTQCDYARTLLDRGAPGDRQKALELLGEALETCQELGLKRWLDLCLELKLRAQGVDSGSVETSIEAVAASLGSRRPDLAPHAAPDGTVTLIFSDMEGFTPMTERLGDLKAREVIRRHNAIVREQTSAHDGYEVELQGDGFLLAFPSARRALLCAIAIQRAFAAYSEAHPEEPIRVRIGLHTGEVLRDADRFFGRTVILAARIAGQARGGEILVSTLVKKLTESTGDLRFDAGREVELKGISEPQPLHAVEWE